MNLSFNRILTGVTEIYEIFCIRKVCQYNANFKGEYLYCILYVNKSPLLYTNNCCLHESKNVLKYSISMCTGYSRQNLIILTIPLYSLIYFHSTTEITNKTVTITITTTTTTNIVYLENVVVYFYQHESSNQQFNYTQKVHHSQ